jgi:hypothetical protein
MSGVAVALVAKSVTVARFVGMVVSLPGVLVIHGHVPFYAIAASSAALARARIGEFDTAQPRID